MSGDLWILKEEMRLRGHCRWLNLEDLKDLKQDLAIWKTMVTGYHESFITLIVLFQILAKSLLFRNLEEVDKEIGAESSIF